MSILLATSKASKSWVRRTYAFFWPSGLIRELIFCVSMSYIFLIASFICTLLARTSTMKTRVLFSSIFFMADSVVSGYFRIWYLSRRLGLARYLRGYLPSRGVASVLGKWNRMLVRIFFVTVLTPLVMALATPLAFVALALPLPSPFAAGMSSPPH